MFYQCPVCGYNQMLAPPSNHYICPCCGTEFGYDDFAKAHRALRNEWLSNGAPWFSSTTAAPFLWNGFRQVIEAGLPSDIPAPHGGVESFFVELPNLAVSRVQVQVS